MGMENDVMLSYLEDNERFADVFNYGYFGGLQVVKPQDLEEASATYNASWHYRADSNTRSKAGSEESSKTGSKTGNQVSGKDAPYRIRDIKKRLKSGKELKILAVESQSHVNYIMPWRCMDYDCREYGKQISRIQKANRKADKFGGEAVYADAGERLSEFKQEDRIAPVYTLCIYHGVEPWNGPRSLKDMMNFGEGEDEKQLWEKYFADYPMRLICVNELTDCSKFQTSLREVFSLLPHRKDKKKVRELLQNNPEYSEMDRETAQTISVLMGVDAFMEREERYKSGGKYNMCQALREMMEDSRKEGRVEGHAEGHAEGCIEGHTLGLAEGMRALIMENLDEGVGEQRIVEKLQKYFSLSEEEAKKALEDVQLKQQSNIP